MPAVKVCGLTRVEDARLAWELGAAALGFVFHLESPRAVTVSQARRLRTELPPEAVCIGVFVDRPAEEMNAFADEVGLNAFQLHGTEGPELVSELNRPVIKALRAKDLARLQDFPVVAFLLDASHPTLLGGTGRLADWALAGDLARRHRLILAGGLHPANVEAALRIVNPAGLDLSSGLESSPGRKDPELLKALFRRIPTKGERPCLF
jgi:phosphoribosylanthranilate isomerase